MRWNPSLHPRGRHGQFVASLNPKLSHSIRLSPHSVSYNAGVRVQIVPGRANLYVGALARVERANSSGLLKRKTDAAVNSVARRFGDERGRSNVAQVLKGNQIRVRGLGIQGPERIFRPPTFRVSSTPSTRVARQVRVRNHVPRVRRTGSTSRTPNLTGTLPSRKTPAIAAAPRRKRKARRKRSR